MEAVPVLRNVEVIRAEEVRVIRGRVPQQVRRELMEGVRAGLLGRLPKDGLKPEAFFHPDHRDKAVQQQQQIALDAVRAIASVVF